VDWLVPIIKESLRVCRGLVAFVVEGKTRHFSWSGTPALLMADLLRAGITLRKPPIYERDGIPGSGGPDWWKNRYEFIVCATNGERLPWSDNTACGHPPKYGCFGGQVPHGYSGGDVNNVLSRRAGGPFSNRSKDGKRTHREQKAYELANPGNVIDCGAVGGGKLGSNLAHENEAPFPEKLVEPFILSFCPPAYCHVCGCVSEYHNGRAVGQSSREFVRDVGKCTQSTSQGATTCSKCGAVAVYPGTVLDPFCGSGTTAAVAEKHGRNWISIDIRPSQIELLNRRLREVRKIPPMPIVKREE